MMMRETKKNLILEKEKEVIIIATKNEKWKFIQKLLLDTTLCLTSTT